MYLKKIFLGGGGGGGGGGEEGIIHCQIISK